MMTNGTDDARCAMPEKPGYVNRWLPLYEAKMLHHYDAQWATYEPDGAGGWSTRLVTPQEKYDPEFFVMPRYWVPEHEVETRLDGWDQPWLLGWRDICRSTDERTLIAARGPRAGYNHKFMLALDLDPVMGSSLQAAWSSFVCDYIARQKMGGTSMSYFVIRQLPVPAPNALRRLDGRDRHDLDAHMFRAYGLARDDVAYLMDTFPIVRRKDLASHGEYRTKRLILEAFDALSRPDDRTPPR